MLYSDPMMHPRWIFAAAVLLVLLIVSLVKGDPYAGYTAADSTSLSRMSYETANPSKVIYARPLTRDTLSTQSTRAVDARRGVVYSQPRPSEPAQYARVIRGDTNITTRGNARTLTATTPAAEYAKPVSSGTGYIVSRQEPISRPYGQDPITRPLSQDPITRPYRTDPIHYANSYHRYHVPVTSYYPNGVFFPYTYRTPYRYTYCKPHYGKHNDSAHRYHYRAPYRHGYHRYPCKSGYSSGFSVGYHGSDFFISFRSY